MALASLTRDLLVWIDERPRTYGETMEAWKTHCPRLSIWEDALLDGLVRVEGRRIALTVRGEAALARSTTLSAG
jgi:hypothetical protein